MHKVHDIVRANVKKAQARQKAYYDQKAVTKDFDIGDLVLLKNNTKKTKIDPNYIGPFIVTKVDDLGANTIEIDSVEDPGQPFIVAKARCKLYHELDIPVILIEESVPRLFDLDPGDTDQ